MADEQRKKKTNVRRAHRASATKYMKQVEEVVERGEVNRLRQLKQFLSGKLRVLAGLDEEIIELMSEEDLESEIESADGVRENIELAILLIEDELNKLSLKGGVAGDHAHDEKRGVSLEEHSMLPSGDDKPRVHEGGSGVVHSTLSISSIPSAPVTTCTYTVPSITTTPYLTSSTHSSIYGMPPLVSLPSISSTGFSVSSSSLMPIPGSAAHIAAPYGHTIRPTYTSTAAMTTMPLVPPPSVHYTDHSTPISRVKLPKLSIKKFTGDLTQWVAFWDSFDSAIHSNYSLSPVDKFNYLRSYLESSAAEAVAGLTVTSANYDEAIAILKKRFGNQQLIINRHMGALLNVNAVSSHLDIKGLRKLHDNVETQIRGLRALGVPTESYGSLLISLITDKLPTEIRMIISRKINNDEHWELNTVMEILEGEVEVRENAASSTSTLARRLPVQHKTPISTGASLLTGAKVSNNTEVKCVYCGQKHASHSCTVVTDVSVRKDVLRKAGRCYVCLRKNHVSKNCRSGSNCRVCRGRHHTTICTRRNNSQTTVHSTTNQNRGESNLTSATSGPDDTQNDTTSNMYAGTQSSVLLQTAKLQLFNVSTPETCIIARAVLDSGSQRTYVTDHLRNQLNLPTIRSEFLKIKTFGTHEPRAVNCDVVELNLIVEEDNTLSLSALVIPFICNPLTSQPINQLKNMHEHLVDLDLADAAEHPDALEVDVLVGSDSYWKLVTGRIIRGDDGPIAIHTRVGWVLSGPVNHMEVSINLVCAVTHSLKIDIVSTEPTLDDQLKRFWDLESLGIVKEEASVYEKFIQRIRLDNHRYEVCLPWKESHPPLPDHQGLCRKRLLSLLKRLRQTPELLTEYEAIMKDQLYKGIIEAVEMSSPITDRTHYLPHHGVVRKDKSTSKLRIVYDASARTTGPSLNDCLYTGPKSGQSIFDILLRFRLQKIAITGDIEKAFLMLSVHSDDRDSLRFLWVDDPNVDTPDIRAFRFTRAVFGVSSSPFLLNATIKHHIESFLQVDPCFVRKFLSSIYVDDLVSGAADIDSAYKFYHKSRERLKIAGFKLRKFVSNSQELNIRIKINKNNLYDEEGKNPRDVTSMETPLEFSSQGSINEEDQSYAKSSLGTVQSGIHQTGTVNKVLGVEWDTSDDTLMFDVGAVSDMMKNLPPTKRNVIRAASRFFDPLGFVSPVTILFKIFAQQLCTAKVGWDDPLSENNLMEWNNLLLMLKEAKPLIIPRYIFFDIAENSANLISNLIGFCDASSKAYAAVVYLRFRNESDGRVNSRLVTAKTRVAPVSVTMTIPRLELLSALLLSKLIVSVQEAFVSELQLGDPICLTDSKVALFWIKGMEHEWKQFVQHRVESIRCLVEPKFWKHCPGRYNPSDIPSRGMSIHELVNSNMWLKGPDWIQSDEFLTSEWIVQDIEPEAYHSEMKCKPAEPVNLLTMPTLVSSIGTLVDSTRFSSVYRLFHVTKCVLQFVYHLMTAIGRSLPPDYKDCLERAKWYWVKDNQSCLTNDHRFNLWKRQLDLYLDKWEVWRCGGRMAKSCLSLSAQNPILLDKDHHLTELIVMRAHHRVLHNGVKDTLAELRSEYWLVKGRQYVRRLIHKCVVCKRQEGKPCEANPPPPLPEFRVQQCRPFQTTGVDFAGPLFVRPSGASDGVSNKTWLCLYTCCATRAVHLDLVNDMTTATFIRSFKRFTARRGVPSRVISDNGRTFKSASKIITQMIQSSETKEYFDDLHVEWQFNLERAPWWGGIFERMIKSAKRCLRKSIGRNCLSHDELLTLIVEVEAVLNSRPLTYVSSEDVNEPLTPSHLLVGYRILTLPDYQLVSDHDVEHSISEKQLNCKLRHLENVLQHFWNRWKKEYLLELREFHRTHVQKGNKYAIEKGDVVTIYDEGHPRGLWRLGKVEELIRGADGLVRGAQMKVVSKNGSPRLLRRPLQHIYPLEVRSDNEETPHEDTPPDDENNQQAMPIPVTPPQGTRGVRKAAIEARSRIRECMSNIEDSDLQLY